MKIGIDIDNVISNFNDTLLTEYLLHDKELRNSGIINKNADYIRKGMFDWNEDEEINFYKNNIERIAKKLGVMMVILFVLSQEEIMENIQSHII